MFSFLSAPMPGKSETPLPRTTGTKRKHNSIYGLSKANYCTMITAAAWATQFPDGRYEARADGFMWCMVCDVVIRHDHKNFAMSCMNYNSKHKARVGEAKKTLGAEDQTQPECTTGPEKAVFEVQLNVDFLAMPGYL